VRVPWAFGPILTAGVTLGAATVVVANPVVVPRADVQIPAAHLPVTAAGVGQHGSAHGSALDMLDEDFIRAVGPGPTASANPLAALTDLVRVLVADAAQMGRSAVLHAFATGARVIADPVLTSTSYPYLPAAPSDPAALPWSGPTPPVAAGDLGPVVAQALTAILADVGDVSGARAIVSAFAAGAALASEQLPVLGVVESVQRDLRGVLVDTASVVSALPGAREVIGDAIRTAFTVLPVIVPAPIAVPGFGDPPVPGFGDPPVPGFGDPPVPDTDVPVVDAPANDAALADSGTDDPRVASPLADRRSGPVDDGPSEQAVEPVEPIADDEIAVTDKPAGLRPSGIADALGLTQRAQRESGEAAGPAVKQRAGRTAR
jgi:hypothetical protein